MTAAITGTHPYAAKFPMLSDAEIDDLAESIATVGLLHPIVVDSAGRIVDGRNRLEACNRAQVEAQTVVYEGSDIAEYVIACNVTRRNMSTGARAMATALVLAEDGQRIAGKWDGARSRSLIRGSSSTNSESSWVKAMTQCGVVIDYLPALAQQVVDGELALDAAYRQACDARDAERLKLEEQERIAAEEADAKAFVKQNAPDLAAQVGAAFETFAEAHAVWEKRNREEAARIAAQKRAQAERADAERENARDQVRMVARGLISLDGMQHPEWRDRTRSAFAKYADAAPPSQRELHNPNYLRELSKWLTDYADELEQQ